MAKTAATNANTKLATIAPPDLTTSNGNNGIIEPVTNYPTPLPDASVAFNAPTSNAEVVQYARPPGTVPDQPDPIDQGLLTIEEAIQCLASFGALQEHFPCVDMRVMDFEHLRRSRPFLFLCILASTTSLKPDVCAKLDVQVRETIAQRVIIQAEKSVDLLEGTLVYLAW